MSEFRKLTAADHAEVLRQINLGIQKFYLASSDIQPGSSAMKPTQDLTAMTLMASQTLVIK